MEAGQILPGVPKQKQRQDYGGSFFDDLVKKGPTDAEINSLAIRTELNQRTGAAVFVQNQGARTEMRKVIKYWLKIDELHHDVQVLLDFSMGTNELRVAYPR